MVTKIEEIIERLKSLTLLEAADLVKRIEDTFNVTASIPVGAVGVLAPVPSALAQDIEEQTEFTVVLEEVPADKKIPILKVVRTLTGLGLKEAKDLVEATPKNIKENVSKDEGEAAKKQLEDAGAKVKIK